MGAPGPVTNDVWRFMDLMRYQGKLHKPAYLQLTWGGRTGGLNFRGYLKTATATFTLFNRSGEPIRAKVNASFEEAISANERLRQQNSSSPDLLRTWEVEAHQTLYLIAQEAYGDTRYWRAIARVNEIESPRSLTVGTILMLPAAAR